MYTLSRLRQRFISNVKGRILLDLYTEDGAAMLRLSKSREGVQKLYSYVDVEVDYRVRRLCSIWRAMRANFVRLYLGRRAESYRIIRAAVVAAAEAGSFKRASSDGADEQLVIAVCL